MQLETDLVQMEILTSEGIAQALLRLDPAVNTRAILSTGTHHYIQAGAYANGYVIERRSGTEGTHVHARHAHRQDPLPEPPVLPKNWWQRLFGGLSAGPGPHDHAFSIEEAIEVFTAYFEGVADPDFIIWFEGYS